MDLLYDGPLNIVNFFQVLISGTIKLGYKKHLEIKRFCLLYPMFVITEEISIDFHYWDQKKCPIFPYIRVLNVRGLL